MITVGSMVRLTAEECWRFVNQQYGTDPFKIEMRRQYFNSLRKERGIVLAVENETVKVEWQSTYPTTSNENVADLILDT